MIQPVTRGSSGRLFNADISVSGAPGFEVMIVGLRAENSTLEFLRWERGDFPGEVIAVPVTRDGVQEIAFGVRGVTAYESGNVDLGRLVFAVRTSGSIMLSQSDFEVRVADILTPSGVARMGSTFEGSGIQVARIVENSLAPNRPNPFNPSTSIAFSLAEPSNAELRIYDVRGAVVRRLLDERRPAGMHVVGWDGRNDNGQPVASGVYFYRLVAGSFTDAKKMTILK